MTSKPLLPLRLYHLGSRIKQFGENPPEIFIESLGTAFQISVSCAFCAFVLYVLGFSARVMLPMLPIVAYFPLDNLLRMIRSMRDEKHSAQLILGDSALGSRTAVVGSQLIFPNLLSMALLTAYFFWPLNAVGFGKLSDFYPAVTAFLVVIQWQRWCPPRFCSFIALVLTCAMFLKHGALPPSTPRILVTHHRLEELSLTLSSLLALNFWSLGKLVHSERISRRVAGTPNAPQ